MNKEFKVGQVWKTINGSKVVIVDKNDENLIIAMPSRKEFFDLYLNGKYVKSDCAISSLDLVEPWVEPKSTEITLEVYKEHTGKVCITQYYLAYLKNEPIPKHIDTIKIKYTEGIGAEIVK